MNRSVGNGSDGPILRVFGAVDVSCKSNFMDNSRQKMSFYLFIKLHWILNCDLIQKTPFFTQNLPFGTQRMTKERPILLFFGTEEVFSKAILRTVFDQNVVFSPLSEFLESKFAIYCKKHRFWTKIDHFAPKQRPKNASKFRILRKLWILEFSFGSNGQTVDFLGSSAKQNI